MFDPLSGVAAALLAADDGLTGRYRLDRDCRFLAADRPAQRLFGLPFAELRGRCLWELVLSLRGSELERRYGLVLAGAGPQLFLFHHASLDHWYAVAVEPVGGTPLPQAIDIRFRDLSESQAPQPRIAAERLAGAARVAGRLAHDFNNCLTVILGNAEYLAEALADRPDLAGPIRQIVDASDRATALTARVLQFARPRRQVVAGVRPEALLKRLAERLRAMAPDWQVALSIAPGLPPMLADADDVETALLELAANARRAMPEGGTVTLTAEVAGCGERLRLAVADTGPGMPAELLARCPEPFASGNEAGWARGLGLSVAAGLARANGGELLLEQPPGSGLVAVLELPMAPRQQPAAVRPGHVLVVEDDAANRAWISRMLGDLGYGVTAAASAGEALAALPGAPPGTLLLSDVVLPGGLDGGGLVAAARRLRPALPVLLMSGFAARGQGVLPGREDGTRLLAKPFRKAELEQALRDTCLGGVA